MKVLTWICGVTWELPFYVPHSVVRILVYRRQGIRSYSITVSGISRKIGRVHVVRIKKSHVDKLGGQRTYESVLLRRTFGQDGKVCNETMGNLSMLSAEADHRDRGHVERSHLGGGGLGVHHYR